MITSMEEAREALLHVALFAQNIPQDERDEIGALLPGVAASLRGPIRERNTAIAALREGRPLSPPIGENGEGSVDDAEFPGLVPRIAAAMQGCQPTSESLLTPADVGPGC